MWQRTANLWKLSRVLGGQLHPNKKADLSALLKDAVGSRKGGGLPEALGKGLPDTRSLLQPQRLAVGDLRGPRGSGEGDSTDLEGAGSWTRLVDVGLEGRLKVSPEQACELSPWGPDWQQGGPGCPADWPRADRGCLLSVASLCPAVPPKSRQV